MRGHSSSKPQRIECLFAFLLLASIVCALVHLGRQGYLPQPFYYQIGASEMDLYSTAYWAYHQGAYTVWHSLYPPISFDFLRLFTVPACYFADEATGRRCDPIASIFLYGMFLLNLVLVWLTYRRVDRLTAIPRTIAVAAGLPMLYALERGNLLIPCFTAFVLGAGTLVSSPVWRKVALAVSVNFKPYLLVVILPAVARRDWRWLLGFGVIGLLIYGVTFLLQGDGTPAQLLTGMGAYAGGKQDALWANLYFSTSYWPLIRFLEARQAFAATMGPRSIAIIGGCLVGLMRMAQIGSAGCMVAAIARPSRIDANRFMALYAALIFTTVTNGSSGYAQFFLYFLVFLEPWRGAIRIAILISAYLLCLPADQVIWPMMHGATYSFLGGREVSYSFGVSVGQILRPGLLLVVQFGLIALNLRDSFGARDEPCGEQTGSPHALTSVAGAFPKL